MEVEFEKVVPPPQSIRTYRGSMHKTVLGVATSYHKVQLSYPEIKAYYNAELARLGWKFVSEGDIRYDGVDYGGKKLNYCKGNYSARVQYAGQQEEQFGWTYAFSLTWGTDAGCR
jgi:hypothetical protein